MSTTHSVNSSAITQGAGIPDDALDALVAATIPGADDGTDLGPVPAAPNWCGPDVVPDYSSSTRTGDFVTTWERSLGDDVWVYCEDTAVGGRVLRSAPRIGCEVARTDGMTADRARALAAELIAAANLLDDN